MSVENRLESFLRFGVTVLLYPFKEPNRDMPNDRYPYLLFDSNQPIDVAVGDVECQLDLNDAILHTLSINKKQKSHEESASMSRDYNVRADFNIELQIKSDAASSELPVGTVATLLIKHGSEKYKPHKFTLIKTLESVVNQAKKTHASSATLKAAPPVSKKPLKLSAKAIIEPAVGEGKETSPPLTTPKKTAPPVRKKPLESSIDQAKAKIEKAADGLKKATKDMKQQNVLTLSARRIAKHMHKFTELASDTSEGDKITDSMQLIVQESEEIKKRSEQIAQACIQPILRQNLQAELAKIPDVLQPLKFLLRNLKKKQYDEEAAQGAVDLLTTNATNLRSVVEAILKSADTAIIKVPQPDLEKLAIKGKLSTSDLQQVRMATWAIRAKWYSCGLALGVTCDTLDAIERTHRGVCDDCFTETLKEWLKGANPPPTWSTLCNALESPSVGYI